MQKETDIGILFAPDRLFRYNGPMTHARDSEKRLIMKLYRIEEKLREFSMDSLSENVHSGRQYVGLLSPLEWQEHKAAFEFGIDMELNTRRIASTKAEVNYDCLTGTLLLPDRSDLEEKENGFAFALDEKGIVFIDNTGTAEKIVREVMVRRRWKYPSLERFLYDFLEEIIRNDVTILDGYEEELDRIEDQVFSEEEDMDPRRVNSIRNDLRTLRIHYEQMMDLGEELEQNENGFFKEENVRFFRMFTGRVTRLHTITVSLRDYAMQLRDLYQAQMDVKQNRIMTVLTVVTTIFMPLTLIVGWYGMNFQNMPELSSPYGYIGVIILSILVVIGGLLFFHLKKWL